MVLAEEAADRMRGLSFERVETHHGSTYRDNSTAIVIPTRGEIHWKVVQAWQNLVPLMNQKRGIFFAVGMEVGDAYNRTIAAILADKELSTWKYVLTLEDDNLPPPDAHVRLLEAMDLGAFDAVSGIYFTKGDVNMPMAYGDPNDFRSSGVLDFRPLDIRRALAAGRVVETNGIGMGCGLWKMSLFREFPSPWFVTENDWIEGKGTRVYTQDLNFCERAKRAGKRFGVDCRVRVGHLDPGSGIVY